MTITNGYCTLAELHTRLDIATADTADDTTMEAIIETASRHIDNYCRRHFYAATETRYFTAAWGDWLEVDDILTVTTLKTDIDGDRTYETTWETADYDLMPHNAVTDGAPYTSINTTPQGTQAFPTGRKAVQIVGSFGYAATAPKPVKEACLLLATFILKRRDAPFGVLAGGEFEQAVSVSKWPPDVLSLLQPYRRWGVHSV